MPTETPGVWTLKPGQDGYDAACRAAMMACGIDPDGFGTYTQRNDAQGAIRKAYNDQHGKNAHRSPQALNDMGTEQYLCANSESGHQVQNACFTAHRHDPCGNYPPADGNPGTPSAFGYHHDRAPSTDHHGRSCDSGTTHGEISRHLDRQWEGQATGTPLTAEQLRRSAAENAAVHVSPNVTAQDPAHFASMSADRRDRAARINGCQQANAERLLDANPDAAAIVAANQGIEPGSPASPSAGGPTAETQAFAAECQAVQWEKDMEALRADAINNSPIGQSAACADACAAEGVESFTQLSPEAQQRVVQANTPGPHDPPPGTPPAMYSPQPREAGNPPTQQDCMNDQGNYLAWQTANNGGRPPGWAGQVPPRAIEGETANPGASTGVTVEDDDMNG
ncbi:MAG: hypothetical protein KF729_37590 [Sandaracinaceae bacterium]|nr:hypothetical protein [Sandaracinaceae bacterium]